MQKQQLIKWLNENFISENWDSINDTHLPQGAFDAGWMVKPGISGLANSRFLFNPETWHSITLGEVLTQSKPTIERDEIIEMLDMTPFESEVFKRIWYNAMKRKH